MAGIPGGLGGGRLSGASGCRRAGGSDCEVGLVPDGWWSVPEEVYSNVTAWLGEHIRRECEMEAQGAVAVGEVSEPERTLRLVLPAS